MIHYAGYTNDLPGEIVRLAGALDITMTPDRAQELAAEATLEQMRDRADQLLPNAGAIWSDDRAFFRAGSFGEWRTRVNDDDLAEYDRTVGWCHPSSPPGPITAESHLASIPPRSEYRTSTDPSA